MKRNHYLILGGVALIAGYLWYKNDKDKKARKASLSMSTTPLKAEEVSNIGGTCTCGNGFTGYCAGDCRKCCKGMDTPRKPAQYRTQGQGQKYTSAYSSNY
jgi:hypothetical protein